MQHWELIQRRVSRALVHLKVPGAWRAELRQHLCLVISQRIISCYSGEGPILNYIDRTAFLEARKWLMAQRSPRELPVEEHRLQNEPAPGSHDRLWQTLGMTFEQVMERLEGLAERLPPLQRQAWEAARLRIIHDRSWADISEELGEDPQRLMERWGQARVKLRRWLLHGGEEGERGAV